MTENEPKTAEQKKRDLYLRARVSLVTLIFIYSLAVPITNLVYLSLINIPSVLCYRIFSYYVQCESKTFTACDTTRSKRKCFYTSLTIGGDYVISIDTMIFFTVVHTY